MGIATSPLYWFQFDPSASSAEEPPKSLTELQTKHENSVLEVLGKMPDVEKWIAYKALYAEGKRIGDANVKTREALSAEWRKIKAQNNTP